MEFLIIAIYLILLLYTVFRIILDTHSTSKTLAYLLLVLLFPLLGVLIYYAFGINYRHVKHNKKTANFQQDFDLLYKKEEYDETDKLIEKHKGELKQFDSLIKFQHNILGEILHKASFKLLINGEEKFPELLRTLEKAHSFIHMEYYAWENDIRGNQIKDVLIRKVKEGVTVRVLYDDYASRKIKHTIVKELRAAGVEIYPKIKIKFIFFANRINHRDHRKIVIVDGVFGFLGGINISDRYDNTIDTGLYWRDTHVKFSGPLVANLQRHFIVSWNAAQSNSLKYNKELFPSIQIPKSNILSIGQVMAGGPVYSMSTIMLSYFKAFSLARKKLYITNPYFIPNNSILNVLKQAAITGVDVRLLMPDKSDSAVVGAASRFYFEELLRSGVKIYLYEKGFIHAKTAVIDSFVSIVGTANMDIRSFDLNFEIMPIIYDSEFSVQLEKVFYNDLEQSRQITIEAWNKNGLHKRLKFAVARLISYLL